VSLWSAPLRALLALPLALALSSTAAAQDGIVKAQLEAKGVKFEVDADGDFKCVFRLESGRTQVVWVRSKVAEYGAIKVREIWSPGYRADTADFPAIIANQLLTSSNGVKLGGWVKQGQNAVFVVKIPGDGSADQLVSGITAAVESADALELALTGKDDL
jgi:hypothetical protein